MIKHHFEDENDAAFSGLNPKPLETHEWVISSVSTDALVPKHKVISIHSAGKMFIVLDQFYAKYHTCSEQH